MSTMEPQVSTYYDAVQWLRHVARSYGQGAPAQMIYRAIQSAYRRIQRDHQWRFHLSNGSIRLQDAQTTGTIAYDDTGGSACERQLTLSGSTWPSDVQDWAIQIDDIVCEVERRYSDTVVQLDQVMRPREDVSAGTSYTAYKRWYRFPNDFRSLIQPMEESAGLRGKYIPPTKMEELSRWWFDTGDIYYYTIRSAPGLYGARALFVHGASDEDETYDFLYRRWARPLRYHGESADDYAGTISVTADSTTVSGDGTSFDTQRHAGSLLWIGDDASNVPTGWEGGSTSIEPYAEQRSIREVTDTSTLTLDAEATTTRSGVKYRITDPIDLDVAAIDAFLVCCEAEFSRLAVLSGKSVARNIRQDLEKSYERALTEAKGADNDVQQRQIVGEGTVIAQRLSYSTSRVVDTE